MYPTFKIKLLFVFFLLGISAPYFYAGDKYQAQALEQLRKEIARAILQKDSSPIQTVLKRYKARNAVTFSGVKDDGDSPAISRFLPKKRPLKVSLDEWQALKRSSEVTLEDTEDGPSEFTLLDLDEDGLRDLIISSYAGGTGLFSYTYAYRRSGGRFVSDKSATPSDESSVTQLYSINGRGADQEADWVRINGRLYLAYRNGEYGKDELFLMRPFSVWPDRLKGIVVEYSYRHTLPRIQKNDLKIKGQSDEKIDAGLFAALQKGLTRIQTQSKKGSENDFGQCPVPANLTSEKQEEYAWPWFGPGIIHLILQLIFRFLKEADVTRHDW